MQTSLSLLGAIATLATRGANAANAVNMATSQCSTIDTCFEGGASSTSCSIASGGCPPCITFADNGCYVKINDACPFGVDCASVWESSTTTSTDSSPTTTPTSGTTASSSTTTPSTTSPSTTTPSDVSPTTDSSLNISTDTPSAGSTTSHSSNGSNTIGEDSSSGGSDMSVVFAIIGAAIGVIAVAVIFLTLVRRSKAAHDEDEDEVPNTFIKVQGPQSTAMYASYNNGTRSAGPSTVPEPSVSANAAMSYYNQQPLHNSSAPSPRVAGRAIPSQPVGLNQSTSTFRPYGNSQNTGVASGMATSGIGGMTQAQPPPVQHARMDGAAPSPHSRRESFEF